MENRIIGFFGVDKYDIILYLSRIIYQLNQKVLLLDGSENKALTYSVPMPSNILYEENESFIVTYRGVDFAYNAPMTREQLVEYQEEYDVILIDFGFEKHKLLHNCTHVVFVIDQKLHNLLRVKDISVPKECKKFLIFYVIYGCKISLYYAMDEIFLEIPKGHIFEVSQESVDLKHSIDCQYNDVIRFHKLTKPYQKLLHSIVASLYPEYNAKEKTKAFQKAKCGR